MRGMNVLFVFAHQDDEFSASVPLARHVRAGDAVHCVYLTNGETPVATCAVRNAESLTALQSLGVLEANISFIGTEIAIPDGGLYERLADADRALAAYVITQLGGSVDALYLLGWEGGHHDHDAAHLLGLALARDLHLLERTRQLPVYHGQGVSGKLFRTLVPLRGLSGEALRLTIGEGLRAATLARLYPSQRKTWIGLFPEAFIRYVLLRRMYLLHVDLRAIEQRPHAGTLLYERMGRVSYERFRTTVSSFIAGRLKEPQNPSRETPAPRATRLPSHSGSIDRR